MTQLDLWKLEDALSSVNRSLLSSSVYWRGKNPGRHTELIAERARLTREIRIAKLHLAALKGGRKTHQ